MIERRLVWTLGVSQLTGWGLSYYLIGVFGERIAADTGWTRDVVYGGFSAALVTMGIASPIVGRVIDRHGGRRVMSAGSVLTTLGCAGLALARDVWTYYAAWVVLGLAMRTTLYDAAFAVLARLGGRAARRPMAHVTLLGGLASTVFWPVGEALATRLGWRGAVAAYAAMSLATLPLHLGLGDETAAPRLDPEPREIPAPAGARIASSQRLAAALYALGAAVAQFLNAGMSAHMIPLLAAMGLPAGTAVGIATLRGIGQSAARLGEVWLGGQVSPLAVHVWATALVAASFVAGLAGGASVAAAAAFATAYGAGNGLATISRGTLPLVLVAGRPYGRTTGWLLAPSFATAASAPAIYALVIDGWGPAAALTLSAALAGIGVAAALVLRTLARATPCGPRRAGPPTGERPAPAG